MRALTALAVAGILAITVLPTVTVNVPEVRSSEATAAGGGCPFAGGAKVAPEQRTAPAPDVKTDGKARSGCPFSAKSGDAAPVDPARERNQV